MMKRFNRYQLPAILWAFFIFLGSSIPGQIFPDLPIFTFDKLIHVVLFGLLSWFTYRALKFQDRYPFLSRNALAASLVLSFLFGAVDELHQALVPGRMPDWYDLLADSGGILLCGAIVLLFARLRRVSAGDSNG